VNLPAIDRHRYNAASISGHARGNTIYIIFPDSHFPVYYFSTRSAHRKRATGSEREARTGKYQLDGWKEAELLGCGCLAWSRFGSLP
jgi:coproporphyrinogen III oxidase-like Fe-S oxidoreductase